MCLQTYSGTDVCQVMSGSDGQFYWPDNWLWKKGKVGQGMQRCDVGRGGAGRAGTTDCLILRQGICIYGKPQICLCVYMWPKWMNEEVSGSSDVSTR